MYKNKIEKYFRRGDITLIAKMCKVSQSMVSQVLGGKKNSERILEAAISLAEQRKEEKKEREKRLKSL